MQKIRPVVPLMLVFMVSLLLAATPYDQIPAVFNGLVPAGSKLVSQSFVRRNFGEVEMKITMINVTFTASKRFNANHTDFDSEFKFSVSGVESAQEADQWAKACAEQIEKVTPDQIQ